MALVPTRAPAVAFAAALAACGHPVPAPAPIGNGAPALIERAAEPPPPPPPETADPRYEGPPELSAPDDRAAQDTAVAMLRELLAAAAGDERAQVQSRLFEALDRHPDPARRAEALAIGAALVASADFATLPTADATLFVYAAALHRAGRDDEARATWTRLVKDFPSSKLVPEVYVALGDAAFEASDLSTASAFYQQALRFPGAASAAYARYKQAWVDFNLARFDEALAGFAAVVRDGKDPLRRAALKDAVRAYAEVGRPERALAFFQRLDPAHAAEQVLRLAEHYDDVGKGAEAIATYRLALPALDGDGACWAALGIVNAELVMLSDRAAVLAALAALAERARPADCGQEAADLSARVAYQWNLEQVRLKSDPADALAAWALAERLALDGEGRVRAAHAAAELSWQRAAFGGRAEAWADAARAFHHAADAGDGAATAIALDAWTNGLRLSAAIADAARAHLAPLAATPGPLQGRARALLATLR